MPKKFHVPDGWVETDRITLGELLKYQSERMKPVTCPPTEENFWFPLPVRKINVNFADEDGYCEDTEEVIDGVLYRAIYWPGEAEHGKVYVKEDSDA